MYVKKSFVKQKKEFRGFPRKLGEISREVRGFPGNLKVDKSRQIETLTTKHAQNLKWTESPDGLYNTKLFTTCLIVHETNHGRTHFTVLTV